MAILRDIFEWVRKAFGGEADEPEPAKQLPELPPMVEEELASLPPAEDPDEPEFTEGEPVEADPNVVLPPLQEYLVEGDGGFEAKMDLEMAYPGPTDLDKRLDEIKELLHREDEPRQLYDQPIGTAADPAVILPETFETEAAQTDEWGITTQGENDGMSVRLQTRTAYDHTAETPRLYAYYRTFVFDSLGRAITISAETRVTVDTTGPC